MSHEYNTQYGSGVNQTSHDQGQKGGLMQGLKEGVQKVKENVTGNKAHSHGTQSTGYGTSDNAPRTYGADGHQIYGSDNLGTGNTTTTYVSEGRTAHGTGGDAYNSGHTGAGQHGHGQGEKGGLMQGLKEGVQKVKENVSGNKAHSHGTQGAGHGASDATYGSNVNTTGFGPEGKTAYGSGGDAYNTTHTTGTGGYSSGADTYNTSHTTGAYSSGAGQHGHDQGEKGGLMQGLKEGVQKVKDNVSGNKAHSHGTQGAGHGVSDTTYGSNVNTSGFGPEGKTAYGSGGDAYNTTHTTGGYSSGLTSTGGAGGYSSGTPGLNTTAVHQTGYSSGQPLQSGTVIPSDTYGEGVQSAGLGGHGTHLSSGDNQYRNTNSRSEY